MSLTASKVGPYFASGSISFSQLRTNFKETSSGEVKASELLRVTDTTNTNPIVPDATENSEIATSSNLKTSQFRNSIKYYNLNQGSGDTDLNLNIADSTLWNGNLGKTIVKTITLAGTIGSTNGNAAASLDASAVYNALLIITGSVQGTGGSAGTETENGGDGGDALYVDTNNTGTVTIRTGDSAQVYGGGGGGGGGGDGEQGADGSGSTTTTTAEGRGYRRDKGGDCGCYPGEYCSGTDRTGNGDPCCGGGQGTPGECFCCYVNVTTTTNYTITGGKGGEGANGGRGDGYLQTREFGGTGGGGTAVSGAGTGGDGGDGGDGGTYGQDGEDGDDGDPTPRSGSPGSKTLGGTAGRAVAGSGYVIDTENGVDGAYLGLK
jgi:hypothetical protein